MNTVLKIKNLSKLYRLGLIGSTTLSEDIKRLWFSIMGKDDPLLKISEENNRDIKGGKHIWALNNVTLNIQEGDVLGIIGRNGSGKVFLRAAPAGTGIIAGGAIRSVCEVLGIQDVVAKSLGSANPHNVLKACVNGLKSQNSPKILSAIRGKKISEIVSKREAE